MIIQCGLIFKFFFLCFLGRDDRDQRDDRERNRRDDRERKRPDVRDRDRHRASPYRRR